MREHCMSADSRELFSADNYGTKTASRVEWYFVVDPEHGLAILGCISWPVEKKLLQRVGDGKQDISRAGREMPRQAKPPFAFIAALREKNAQLKDHEEEPLGDEEFSAARLYTGPMCALACTDETALAVRFSERSANVSPPVSYSRFVKYNLVLRGGMDNAPDIFKANLETLCHGNRYTTTIHSINSSIVKLSKLTKATKLFRGIRGATLPDKLWKANPLNLRGGVDFAFLSATLEKNVALFYATPETKEGAAMLLEISQGMLSRGADLSWLSQCALTPTPMCFHANGHRSAHISTHIVFDPPASSNVPRPYASQTRTKRRSES